MRLRVTSPTTMRLRTAALFVFGQALIFIGATVSSASTQSCQFVTIRAEKQVEGQSFSQLGVGWVLAQKSQGSLFILTPSHVVSQSDRISIRCGGVTAQARLLGNSPTLDVSVLKMEGSAGRFDPLLHLDEQGGFTGFIPIQTGSSAEIRVVESGREASPVTLRSAQYQVMRKGPTSALPASGSIQVEMAAVKPGFSGSPLFDSTDLSMPIGMVTKTLNNGSRSLAIPLDEILAWIPDLLRGTDPWSVKQGWGIDYQVHLNRNKRSLERTRFLQAKDPQISSVRLEEECPSMVYSLTSEWSETAGGGDWGDGGGGKPTGTYTEFPDYKSTLYSVYKSNLSCTGALRLNGTRTLLGIRDPSKNRFQKTTSLDAIFEMVQEHPKDLLAYLNQYGLFKGENDDDYSIACRPDLFGEELTTREAGIGGTFRTPVRVNGETLSYLVTQVPLQSTSQSLGSSPGVGCSRDRKTITVQHIEGMGGSADLVLKFKLSPHETSGFLVFNQDQSCIFKFQAKKDYWDSIFETERLKLRVSLDPSKDLFVVSILEIPPECRPASLPGHPFLYTIQGRIEK